MYILCISAVSRVGSTNATRSSSNLRASSQLRLSTQTLLLFLVLELMVEHHHRCLQIAVNMHSLFTYIVFRHFVPIHPRFSYVLREGPFGYIAYNHCQFVSLAELYIVTGIGPRELQKLVVVSDCR